MKKIALITGANKGIGLETARQLGKENYTVLVGARNEELGRAAVEELRSEDIDAHLILIDPTDANSVAKAAATVTKQFGVLDVLINNAGMMLEADRAAPAEVATSVFRDTYEVNVFGLHEVTRAFWPLLNKSKAARLVNVSSMLGSLTAHADGTMGDFKVIAYDSSKAAVNMMTVHYAWQWRGTPHKANTIHPGSVLTDLNKKGQLTVVEGAKTSVALAMIGEDGPNGGYFHMGKTLPW